MAGQIFPCLSSGGYSHLTARVIFNWKDLTLRPFDVVQIFYGYYVTILLVQTSVEATTSLYISLKTLMEHTLITDETF